MEILDSEGSEEMGEIIPLLDVWTVQDKPSKKKGRYGFEVRVLHTVSAHSLSPVCVPQSEGGLGGCGGHRLSPIAISVVCSTVLFICFSGLYPSVFQPLAGSLAYSNVVCSV